MDDGRRERAVALLESQHRFPGPYEFRVVVRADGVSGVVSALAAALARPSKVEERRSGTGKWISVHYTVEIGSAEEVLDVYDLLRQMDQVVLVM
jgi:putative lipoic acid-binding regulatory protein